ncbi:MAG: hypothetical protein HY981_03930 [Candidatus Magasanikbacteria bacterium]|nr:hypothetical protein [Candidatus Magasanikbacteria bacterium]
MMTKKIVLVASLAMLVFVLIISNPLTFGFCQSISEWGDGTKYCNYSYNVVDTLAEETSFYGFFLSIPLLILSLITYKMRDEVFQAWWRFARWWVPVIIAVTLFVQNAGGGGGWGMNGGAFDAFFIGIFYVIFIIVSLVKIVRAYLKTKDTGVV